MKRHNDVPIDLGNEGPVLRPLCAPGRLEENPEDSMKMGRVTLYGVAFFVTKPVCLEPLLAFVCYACIYDFTVFSLFLLMKIKILVFFEMQHHSLSV